MDAPPAADPHAIASAEALAALYPAPSALVLGKVSDRLDERSARFVAASPFCLLSTVGERGPHVSPRGDAPGFVAVPDPFTVVLPDRRGNHRLDALRDVLADPRVALLFLVPGVGETLRVHGRARITTDPALRAAHAAGGAEPATLLVVSVTEVYLQCARALLRSRLWGGRPRAEGAPTGGQLLAEHTRGRVSAEEYDERIAPRVAGTLY